MADPTAASATSYAPTLLDLMFRDSGLAVHSHGGPSPSPPGSTPTSCSPTPKKKNADPDFGEGLRRGFFLDRGPNKGKQDPTIPTIKRHASSSKLSSLVLPEVRAALDREAEEDEAQRARALPPAFQALLGRGDWMTPDLQQRIQANPGLRQALGDPRVVQALEELCRDPQAALRKHQDDPAVGACLAALSGLLGDHFEALGKQEGEQQPPNKIVDVTGRGPEALARERAEQAAADEILRDPEVCALLLDPDVRAVLEACRALQPTANDAAPGSGRAREALARRMREPEMAGKLRRLAAAGVVRLGIGLDEKYVGAYGKQ